MGRSLGPPPLQSGPASQTQTSSKTEINFFLAEPVILREEGPLSQMLTLCPNQCTPAWQPTWFPDSDRLMSGPCRTVGARASPESPPSIQVTGFHPAHTPPCFLPRWQIAGMMDGTSLPLSLVTHGWRAHAARETAQ